MFELRGGQILSSVNIAVGIIMRRVVVIYFSFFLLRGSNTLPEKLYVLVSHLQSLFTSAHNSKPTQTCFVTWQPHITESIMSHRSVLVAGFVQF